MKLFLYLSIPLLILDQASKWWIVDSFNAPPHHQAKPGCEEPYTPEKYDQIEVISGFFNIVRVHNTGMAFGIGNGTKAAKIIFPVIACVAIGLIAWLWRKGAFPTLVSKLAVALLLPGILGNLIDRLLPCRGYVVDFLDFILPFYGKISSSSSNHFPSFNVADSCICLAAALLIISAFKGEPDPDPELEAEK
jgi:signal peptidase II